MTQTNALVWSLRFALAAQVLKLLIWLCPKRGTDSTSLAILSLSTAMMEDVLSMRKRVLPRVV
jgi:hypothetical protein